MPLFDHFGFLAPFYDQVIQLKSTDQLISYLELPVEGALLDVGGGTGRVSQVMTGLAGQVVVADLSLNMLRQAQFKGGLAPVNAHSEKLPFPGQCFARILMVDALHHVCNQAQTASEMWRLLKPGGKIVIEEPDVRNLSVKLVALAEKIALMRSHFLSPPKIARLFNQDGAVIQLFQEGFNAWIVIDKGVK